MGEKLKAIDQNAGSQAIAAAFHDIVGAEACGRFANDFGIAGKIGRLVALIGNSQSAAQIESSQVEALGLEFGEQLRQAREGGAVRCQLGKL